ncbi:SRPBCC family protein [Bacillus cereus]|uniref:SRPBCC family protein n=2 Tax=Bacillus cereus group TaxID=86661 RepID=A0A9X6XZQ5_BACCE|nr:MULTISPECIES: SRPBCC family protein [Bacillus]ANV71787.1 3-isopropylmalate dehydrogenase [Bacillus thuringiensis]EEL55784.1 hypothetical protein bcere0023_26010 [Bacillus cereus Rock4-2]KAF6699955.1 SRPBCC family protein [Bacillus sp. EKM501B]MBE5094039.1 SRPBCC family protein [Bacillus thuringiensis]MDA1922426.1 SRPBCC family protein [Bacillus cereus]
MSFAIEIVIKAPLDVVCDYIIEDEKIKEWNTFIIENRYPSNMDKENPRVGDKYITVQKVGKKIFEAEVEILEYNAPHIISLGSEMKQGYSAMTYMLEEDEEGTALTLISEYEPSNFYYKMMYKLTGWISRGLTIEQMERLAECVEAAYHKED